jgi:hypothetical protein
MRNYWIIVVALVAPIVGCSSEFRSCRTTRTCPVAGGPASDGGAAGEGGSDE